MFWDPERYHSNAPATVSFWIIAIGIIINFLSIWELAVRKYALITYIAKDAESLEEALRVAQKKIWVCLLITLPIIFAELAIDLLTVVTSKLADMVNTVSMHDPLFVWNLILSGIEFSLFLPFIWIIVLNSFLCAILVFEKRGVISATNRFCAFIFADFRYVVVFATVFSFVYFSTLGPTVLVLPLEIFLPNGTLKYVVFSIVSIISLAPLDAFLSGIAAIAGAYFYKQERARLECGDLLEKLSQIRA